MFAMGGLNHSPRSKKAIVVGRVGGKQVTPKGRTLAGTKENSNLHTTSRPAGKPGAQRTSKTTKLEILRVPGWEAYRWLVHGFSTRTGGVSTAYLPGKGKSSEQRPSYGELNLGFTTTDTRENVVRNRELFVRAMLDEVPPDKDGAAIQEIEMMPLRLLRQIHSGMIHRAENSVTAMGGGTEPPSLQGDGWIATRPGTLLGIQTADCIPVLVVDVRQRIVAAFHAGWRGTLARIVERGVGRLRAEFRSRPGDLTAAIGPGIGVCCYSVGEEVRMEFRSQFGYAEELFQEVFDLDPIKEKYPMLFLTARAPGHSNLGPSLHLDLIEANRRQLLDAGLSTQKIHLLNRCTACDSKRFFSHRAERGYTGRMVSAIGIRPSFL